MSKPLGLMATTSGRNSCLMHCLRLTLVSIEVRIKAFPGNNLTGTGNSLYIDDFIKTREALAAYIKAPTNETHIVDDASHGLHAILRPVPAFLSKTAILYLDLEYGEVKALSLIHSLR